MPIKKDSLAPEDLILKLNDNTKKINISKYEDFLYALSGEWEFQKEATRNIIRYFMSNDYLNSKQLLDENYKNNLAMKNFAEKDFFLKNIPFPLKKACTIDLATGTGKSWVMYAVARVMLTEGLVDQVLVLCPSKTIKYELNKKFTRFNENSILTDSLPKDSIVPGIINADETIENGDICIDNVHKTYDHVSSSISDSLKGKGLRTLVINDEAHHILNPKSANEQSIMLEWKRFLDDEKYNFYYILNVSGTPYKGDNYFNDVIYRYSIRDAINNKYVKDINYLEKDQTEGWKEKWKAILDNHENLKKEYYKSKKHITIVITNSIPNTDILAEEIKNFLKDNTAFSDEQINNKVIAVTSSSRHDNNREILKNVDSPGNPVEWIVSVSMLTEGWDVSNIYQIVPHESRAFNSKLLISQVLGRGLRIPEEYRNSEIQPKVWIYNHTAWSNKIDHLVMEVAEISTLLSSNIIKDSEYNFDLHKINLTKKIEIKQSEVNLPESLGFSSTPPIKEQVFVNVKTRRRKLIQTDISKIHNRYSIEEATNDVFSTLYLADMECGSNMTSRVSKKYIQNLIEKELNKIGEKTVSKDNLQKAKSSFNGLRRQFTGVSKIEEMYENIDTINTSNMNSSLMSESSFKNYGGLVTSIENLQSINPEELEIINTIKKEINETDFQTNLLDETYIQARIIDDINQEQYKSPLDITLLSHSPERDFVEALVKTYSGHIDAWIKSKDKNFYAIPYIHRPGTHSLQKDFNPDFFIKKGNKIISVEIKSEDDSTVKNKDKLEGAISYFKLLNDKLKGQFKYEFHFLDRRDYSTFFEKVLINNDKFVSKLHADLSSKSREELKEGR